MDARPILPYNIETSSLNFIPRMSLYIARLLIQNPSKKALPVLGVSMFLYPAASLVFSGALYASWTRFKPFWRVFIARL